ncbi:MAG TPA: hypothetical protein VMT63_01245 [Bacteroidales bacterium]|nr:hypothetical protein [Bacteroidales bacterium]
MRKWIYCLAFIFLTGCSTKQKDSYFSTEKALWYFNRVREICNLDSGRLWGKNLYGPLMFVDRQTKKIYANGPDAEGTLKLKDGIYTGTFPREIVLDNAGAKIGGTLFATAPLRQNDDTFRIVTRAVHGLFHTFRKNSGIKPSGTFINKMDERNARLWLKLEWKALRNAISSDGKHRDLALRDALIFRGARREQYPMEVKEENGFECWEGLTTFTYMLLCSKSEEAARQNLLDNLDRTYNFQSYSRSYGFIHGALYAWLAYKKGFDFSTITHDSTDMARIAGTLYNIRLPSICRDVAGSVALAYEPQAIYKEEDQRAQNIKDEIHRQIEGFTENPVVFLELESPYFDFEPEEIRSLDTLGTIYNSIRVSDNWGKLTVEKGGCLVSYNLNSVRIPAKQVSEDKNHITGDGWHLILNDDWHMIKMKENYFIRKLAP